MKDFSVSAGFFVKLSLDPLTIKNFWIETFDTQFFLFLHERKCKSRLCLFINKIFLPQWHTPFSDILNKYNRQLLWKRNVSYVLFNFHCYNFRLWHYVYNKNSVGKILQSTSSTRLRRSIMTTIVQYNHYHRSLVTNSWNLNISEFMILKIDYVAII